MYYLAILRATPEMMAGLETLRRLILPRLHRRAEEYSATLLNHGTSQTSATPVYLIYMNKNAITRFETWLSEPDEALPYPVRAFPGVIGTALMDEDQ